MNEVYQKTLSIIGETRVLKLSFQIGLVVYPSQNTQTDGKPSATIWRSLYRDPTIVILCSLLSYRFDSLYHLSEFLAFSNANTAFTTF